MRQAQAVRLLVFLTCLALAAGCVAVSAVRQALQRATTPTPDAATQEIVAAVMAGAQPITETFAAPDAQWQVEIVIYGCVETGDEAVYAYELLRFAAAGADEWRQADSQLINCGGLGAYGFQAICWSPDGRYFYYTTAREGVPDGNSDWSPPVWQLGPDSGTIRELGAVALTCTKGGQDMQRIVAITNLPLLFSIDNNAAVKGG